MPIIENPSITSDSYSNPLEYLAAGWSLNDGSKGHATYKRLFALSPKFVYRKGEHGV